MSINSRFSFLASSFCLAFVLATVQATCAQETQPNVPTSSEEIKADKITIRAAQLSLIETVRLSTRDSGILERLEIREGQQVRRGEEIASLDSELYRAEYNSAEKELEIAKQETKNDVDLQYAVISAEVNGKVLARSRQAVAQYNKAISSTELERLKLELDRSVLSKEQAERKLAINRLTEELKESQLTIAESRLDKRSIKTPIDGTIVEIFFQPGEWINSGEPIARIINLNKLRVICMGDAEKIDPNEISNDATFVTLVGGDRLEIPARIVFLSPEIDPVEQDFAIWAEIENGKQLVRPGMVGELILQVK